MHVKVYIFCFNILACLFVTKNTNKLEKCQNYYKKLMKMVTVNAINVHFMDSSLR